MHMENSTVRTATAAGVTPASDSQTHGEDLDTKMAHLQTIQKI
jgi:hypothetical protein